MPRVSGLLLTMALSTFVESAIGSEDPPDEPLQIVYHAADSCPGEARFIELVRARTARWHRALPGSTARQIVVEIAHGSGPTVHGKLVVRDSAGHDSERWIDGGRCEEVLDGLALITALAIDPHANTVPLSEPSATPPLDEVPSAVLSAERKEPPSVVSPKARAPRTDAARKWELAIVGGFDVLGGVTAGLAAAPHGVVELNPSGDKPFSMGFHADVRGTSRSVPTDGGTAHFSFLAGGLGACPVRVVLAPGARIEPCVVVDAGALDVTGEGVSHAEFVQRFWLDAGGALRLSTRFARRIIVEAEGAVVAPLVRQSFHFDPDIPVYGTPAFSGVASVRVGVVVF